MWGGDWSRKHFGRALEHEGHLTDLANAVLSELPERFTVAELEYALLELPDQLSTRPDSRGPTQAMRDMASSAYRADFTPDTPLSARMLLPVAAEENHGMEDARFVRFTDADGVVGYRATYTAYDGHDIAPRLITSPDLSEFAIHRLTGSGAHNKGMALFPRLVGGHHLALSRTDGENISLARSTDGVIWDDVGIVHRPTELWELVQLGNCGAPIETDRGWLVLTHGVGPLRTYSLGALLLDLDDPSRVIGRSTEPLLQPVGDRRDGYVPRVVYSCGGIAHRGTLWIPMGSETPASVSSRSHRRTHRLPDRAVSARSAIRGCQVLVRRIRFEGDAVLPGALRVVHGSVGSDQEVLGGGSGVDCRVVERNADADGGGEITPALTGIGARVMERMRSAIDAAASKSALAQMATNSSPPIRPTTSSARTP